MTTTRPSLTVSTSTGQRRLSHLAGSAVLTVHGLVHLIGVLLLWQIADTSAIRFAAAWPAAGPVPGVVFGTIWCVPIVLFLSAAARLATHRPDWIVPAFTGASISIPILCVIGTAAIAGVALDVVILALCLRTAALFGVPFGTRGRG